MQKMKCKFPSFLCFLIKSLLVLLRLTGFTLNYDYILPLFMTIYFSAFLFMRLDLCKSAVYEGLVSFIRVNIKVKFGQGFGRDYTSK